MYVTQALSTMKTYGTEEVRALADYQVLSVHEAADILGISMQRVRQMIHGGQLAARRSSAGWLIPAAEVAERSERLHRGRPPEPHTAWSVLALLAAACACVSEDDQPGCIESAAQVVPDRKLRSRVLHVLASLPDPVADQTPWRRLLSARGKVHHLWVHPGVLDRLAADPRVSKGGAEAMVSAHDGLTMSAAGLELYVHEADADELIRGYRMQEDRNGQVHLIVVPSSVPPELAPDRGSPVPTPAAASDLLEEKDPRARYAGAIELRFCLDALRNIGWLDQVNARTTQRQKPNSELQVRPPGATVGDEGAYEPGNAHLNDTGAGRGLGDPARSLRGLSDRLVPDRWPNGVAPCS